MNIIQFNLDVQAAGRLALATGNTILVTTGDELTYCSHVNGKLVIENFEAYQGRTKCGT